MMRSAVFGLITVDDFAPDMNVKNDRGCSDRLSVNLFAGQAVRSY